MDLYGFINSKDVAEYLRRENYQFSTTEAMWFVYQNVFKSLDEKIEAWNWIIENMPDGEICEQGCFEPIPSIHAELKTYIGLLEKYQKIFKEDSENCFYQYIVRHKGDPEGRERFQAVYKSYEDCVDDLKAGLSECSELDKIRRSRQVIGGDDEPIETTYNSKFELVRIDAYELRDVEYNLFEVVFFQVPIPFKTGDIVYNARSAEWSEIKEPIVFKGSMSDDEHLPKYRDYSDMIAWGYGQRDDGSCYCDHMWCYCDLAYYKEPLKGPQRFLKALSSYMKGNIDLELLLLAYRKILFEVQENDDVIRGIYSYSYLKEAGLEELAGTYDK